MSATGRPRRRAGVMVPLFACPSSSSWGIGEIPDLVPLTRWLAGAGVRVLQILPINEMAPDERSPYSALSGMAIDPIYLSLDRVPDFQSAGGVDALLAHPDVQGGMRPKVAAARAALDAGVPEVRIAAWDGSLDGLLAPGGPGTRFIADARQAVALG